MCWESVVYKPTQVTDTMGKTQILTPFFYHCSELEPHTCSKQPSCTGSCVWPTHKPGLCTATPKAPSEVPIGTLESHHANLGQVTWPFYASISSSEKWELNGINSHKVWGLNGINLHKVSGQCLGHSMSGCYCLSWRFSLWGELDGEEDIGRSEP